MEAWHDVLESSQGQMLTRGEKLEIKKKKLNEASLKESWEGEFSVEQVQNKIDGLTKKAMYPLRLPQLWKNSSGVSSRHTAVKNTFAHVTSRE